MPRISKRVVDGLDANPAKETFVWDSELRGFGVRIWPSGHGCYLIQYRNAEGRTRRLTLGAVKVLTPEQARTLAREKLAAVRGGNDPAADKRANRTATTVGDICDWYLTEAEAGRLLGRRRRPVASTTLALDRSRIDTHVKPLIGQRAARGLSIADLEKFQADIAAGKTARARSGRGGLATGGAGVAGRTVGMLHTIFEQASRWGLLEANPAHGVRKIEGDKRRDRRLSPTDVRALGRAMIEGDESPVALAAVTLMLLTGFRRMEVLGLRHEWVDAEAGFVRFPTTKTGPQVRPIGSIAGDLIGLQRKVEGSEFVFPGEAGNDHFVGILRVLERLSATAKIERLTPHVLRHTFASFAADLGFSEMTVAAMLGHSTRGITQRYVHLDKAVLLAANETSAHLNELLKPAKSH